MNLVVVTPPPVEPVTLSEVYDHLRLTLDNDSPQTHPHDAMLQRHIATARREAEKITHRAFVEQTLRLFVDRFPSRNGAYIGAEHWLYVNGPGWIDLPRPPLIAVQSVSYYDSANDLQTLDAANYFVTDQGSPRLYFGDTFSAPALYARGDALRVDYVAGYPPEGSPAEDYTANIPPEVKDAILIGVELLYNPLEPREREMRERARDSLLSALVVYTV